MMPEQVIRAAERARSLLGEGQVERLPPAAKPGETPPRARQAHLRWLAEHIPDLVREGRIAKAMRWLGFLQGAMWWAGDLTIEDAKRANKPTDATYDPNA